MTNNSASAWTFNEPDEDKMSFWLMQWGDSEDCFLVVWPEIREDGSITFSYGHAYDDDGWYEFTQVGYGWKTLGDAQGTCEAWGQAHDPENV